MTAAVPDPRFRDQLAKALSRHYPFTGLQGVVCGGCNWSGRDREYREHLADALAAEVEAAANQRAVEELEAAADWLTGSGSDGSLPGGCAPDETSDGLSWNQDVGDRDSALDWVQMSLRARAAALASAAPAPQTGEDGQ